MDTWNSFAGVAPFDELKPVKKFTNRKAAVGRIWQAVTRRSADGAQPAPDVAPTKSSARTGTQKGAKPAEERSRKRAAKEPRKRTRFHLSRSGEA